MATHLQVCPLHRGRIVTISDVRCRPYCRACGGEEWSEAHQIVFVRSGVFVKRQGKRELVADPNQVLFFNRQETYRVSHPVDGGDDCTVFTFRTEILMEAVELFRKRDEGEQPFQFEHAFSVRRSFLLHQRLRQFLIAGENDSLAIEEASLALLGRVLADAYAACAIPPRRCRTATADAHRQHCDAARLLLATRFAENLTLEDIAASIHVSPFHLARIFRRETGLSIHQYRNCLRLRTALDRINAGATDLTGLALDLGYSSHSHFTDAFRRSFALSPSECRRVSPARLRELSRNLEVSESGAV